MAVCSFSRIVVSLSVLVMAYWAYNMYKMTVTTSCKKGYNCLKPLYPLKKRMQVGKIFMILLNFKKVVCDEFVKCNLSHIDVHTL